VIGIPRRGDVAAYRQAMAALREKVQE